jgi:hypothetical protein
MSLKKYWAYSFQCAKSIEAIFEVLNKDPWQWQQRSSAWYGDYLNSKPHEEIRLRIHEFPKKQEQEGTLFSALLQIKEDNPKTRTDIDNIFLLLLEKIGAENVREIEPYD